MESNVKTRKSIFIVLFFILLIVVSFLTFIIMCSVETKIRDVKFDEIKIQEQRVVELEHSVFGEALSNAISDLKYFQSITKKALNENGFDEDFIYNMTEFSYQNAKYSYMRFLDADGVEQFNITLTDNNAYAIGKNKLKDYSYKDYFKITKLIDSNSVYITPLELSRIDGVVETPYKPFMYLTTPIYSDDENEFLGIVVLNFLAESMLNDFRNIAETSNGEVVLLNSNGDWLLSNQQEREWNFMFQGRSALKFGFYYDEWKIITQEDGQTVTDNGLFTHGVVDLSEKIQHGSKDIEGDILLGDGKLYIVSYILRDDGMEDIFLDRPYSLARYVFRNRIYVFILIFLVCILITFLGFLYYKGYIKTKIHSEFDSLTHLYNRRRGTSRLEDILSHHEREKMNVSLCFVDVNGLKQVNDILGHRSGDELLSTVSKVVRDSIRTQDFAARMGGDEFMIIFYGIGKEESEKVWSRIKNRFEMINKSENRDYIISASHGIVSCEIGDCKKDTNELIKTADELMYIEKRKIKKDLKVIRLSSSEDIV